jgi:hypothetical protein
MKFTRYFCLGLLLMLALQNHSVAQINARTETGRAVILYPDGTWKYAESNGIGAYNDIPRNPISHFKTATATMGVKSSHMDAVVYINPKVWQFQRISPDEAKEYEFWTKWGDGKALLTTETRKVKLDDLRQIAVSNAVKLVPDIRVIREDLRKVNDRELLCLEYEGSINGIQQAFIGYYYAGEHGTLQFITYASREFFEENKKEFTQLLNGLIIGK